MTLTRSAIQNLYQAIISIGGITVPPHMGHALALNRKAAEPVVNFIRAYSVAPSDPAATAMQAAHVDLLEKHRVPGMTRVKIKNNAAYFKAQQKINKEHAAAVKQMEDFQAKVKALLAEQVDIEVMTISASIMPNLPAGAIDGLMPMIQW